MSGSMRARMAHTVTVAVLATSLLGVSLGVGGSAAVAATVSKPSAVLASATSSRVTIVVGSLRVDLTLFPIRQVIQVASPSTAKGRVFLYNPGSGRDGLLTYWVSGGTIRTSFREEHVNGRYRPFAMGGGIFWYAPGPAPDSRWTFASDGTHTTRAEDVDGDYIPVFWHSRQCCDSVHVDTGLIWYAPGTAKDWMWQFRSDGTHSSEPLAINGRYRPIAGWFILDGTYEAPDLLWYSQDGPEYVWSPGPTLTSHPNYKVGEIGPGARPVVGNYVPKDFGYPEVDTIFWYFPGDKAETYWTEGYLEMTAKSAGNIRGDYRPLRFGDHDVLMLGTGTTAELVHLTESGPSGSLHLTGLPPAAVGASSAILVTT